MGSGGETHHVYLIPGLFGFASLAGYDYFVHLEEAIARRFADAGVPLVLERVPALPTSSIAARAAMVARTVRRTAGHGDGPIHFVGHSSGGLDVRLLLSPGSRLAIGSRDLEWLHRARTLVSLNTPHYGTPLAGYFSTVAGTRLLYVLSLLTVTSLSLGHIPLTALAGVTEAVKAVDSGLGLEIRLIDGLTDRVLRVVGERGRNEIRGFMKHIADDRSGILQLMPEVLELFNATVHDRPGVKYACVATSAPPPRPRRLLAAARSPFGALQLAAYTTLYGVTSRADRKYPYAAPDAQQLAALHAGLKRKVSPENVDGVVPTLSMLWGELIFSAAADHLDVVGHFGDDDPTSSHVDWLRSGAHFGRPQFDAMTDALSSCFLRGEQPTRPGTLASA